MKTIYSLLFSGLAFAAALFFLRPEAQVPVVTAGRSLPAGHRLSVEDLILVNYPKTLVPEASYRDPAGLIGQTLSTARSAGDVLFPDNLGGENLELSASERALALQVSDSAGLAGLLKAGDRVGLTAVIFTQSGAFAKHVASGLRVLYISPDFIALDPLADTSNQGLGSALPRSRTQQGTVVLAVPAGAQLVAYDFTSFGVESQSRLVYLADLLPALDLAQNVALSLDLEPDMPAELVTSGVALGDLVITPQPSPTPTPGARP